MVIGVGFHARRIYIPTLFELIKNRNVSLLVGVDIITQKDTINEYFRNSNFLLEMLYVDPLNDKGELTDETKREQTI